MALCMTVGPFGRSAEARKISPEPGSLQSSYRKRQGIIAHKCE